MMDSDLAELYNIETKVFNQSVKRNINRFPEEFMFQLTNDEWETLRSQILTSNKSKGGRRYNLHFFTEYGVVMFSSVLSSERAIYVNIQVVKTFVKLNKMLFENEELRLKIQELELKCDKQFAIVFKVLKELITTPEKKQDQIGFKSD